MNISFPYPMWFLAICVALGLLFAAALYWKDSTFKEATASQRRWIPVLALLRFLGGTAISILLLGLLMKQQITQLQKPSVVIAIDNSESIGSELSSDDSTALFGGINTLSNQLAEKAEIHRFVFDKNLKEQETPDFTGKSTNLSGTFEELYNRFGYQNVGAVILATDGIYNEGSNPAYSSIKTEFPVYTVALGDTTPARDLKIDKVLHNRIAYLGDKFTIRADVSAFNCSGQNTVLNVYSGKGTANKVYSKSLKIDKDRFFVSQDIVLEAANEGIQRYTVSVSKVNQEETSQNNAQTIYVEVLEGRQKLLMLANSPHPDISAIKQSVTDSKNYEIDIVYADEFTGKTADYDLFILHGLPSKKHSLDDLMAKTKTQGLPIWFIATTQTDMNKLNKSQEILEVSGSNSSINEVQARYNNKFSLFNYDGTDATILEDFPPMKSPYGDYKAAPTAQVFLSQKIGTVETTYPLLVFQQTGSSKSAVLAGEGLWKWRMFDYVKNENHRITNELVSKTIQYLSVKNDKRQFRVTQPNNLFDENENISFDAELYNDSYELVNETEANLRVTDEEGKDYTYVFSKTAQAYTLDAGILPVGDYRYTGRTVYNGKDLTSSGRFTVRTVELEALNSTADHNLLQLLSQNYGGEMTNLGGLAALGDKIIQSDAMKPIQYSSNKTKSIINLRWLFFILLAILSIEWFVRKYNGAY